MQIVLITQDVVAFIMAEKIARGQPEIASAF